MSAGQKNIFVSLVFMLALVLAGLLALVAFVGTGNGPGRELSATAGSNFTGTPGTPSAPAPSAPATSDSGQDQQPATGSGSLTTPLLTGGGALAAYFAVGGNTTGQSGAPAQGQNPPAPPATPPGDGQPPLGAGEQTWTDRPDNSIQRGSGNGPISGRVTDPWGNGAPGVRIYVDAYRRTCGQGGCVDGTPDAVTDAQGYYSVAFTSVWDAGSKSELHVPLSGPHLLYFTGNVDGFAARSEWYNDVSSQKDAWPVTAGSSSVNAVLVPSGSLVGTVTGSAASADITVFRADRPQAIASSTECGTGCPGGGPATFSFNLAPGDYKLVAVPGHNQNGPDVLPRPTWYDRAASWSAARIIHVPAAGTISVRLRLLPSQPPAAASIFGSLTVGGLPPAPGTVISLVAADDPNTVLASQTTSANDYSFDFTNLPPQGYKLECTLPGNGHTLWYSATGSGIAGTVHPATSAVDFRAYPPGASVSGRVLRPDGTAVPWAHVTAERYPGDTYAPGTYSQKEGKYAFSGYQSLAAGAYQLCVEDGSGSQPHRYCSAEVALDWYGVLTGINITVPQDFGLPIELSGRVTETDGSPAAGAAVVLTPLDGGAALTVYAGNDGSYLFDAANGLTVGMFTVSASDSAGNSSGNMPVTSISWYDVIRNTDLVLSISGAPPDIGIPGFKAGPPAVSRKEGSGLKVGSSLEAGAGLPPIEGSPPAGPVSGGSAGACKAPRAAGCDQYGADAPATPPDRTPAARRRNNP